MFNDSWHWVDGEKDQMIPGPMVTHTSWGILEPGISKIFLTEKTKSIIQTFRWWRLCCHGLRIGMVLECCEMAHFR